MANPDFTEANVHDLVYTIITPTIREFRRRTRYNLRLAREKTVTSIDGRTGGKEECVAIDIISLAEKKFGLIVGAGVLLGGGDETVFTVVEDAKDSNGEGEVYGFITTGQVWRMLGYDGKSFKLTREFMAIFERMDDDQAEWMGNCSVLVNCILSH